MHSFRLESFPNVCRICLVSNNTFIRCHVNVGKALDELMAAAIPEQRHLAPSDVCTECYNELEAHLAYRKRLHLVGMFISSLVQVRLGKRGALEGLLCKHQSELSVLLRELKITDKPVLLIQDLLTEFGEYKIAAMPIDGFHSNQQTTATITTLPCVGSTCEEEGYERTASSECKTHDLEKMSPSSALVTREMDGDFYENLEPLEDVCHDQTTAPVTEKLFGLESDKQKLNGKSRRRKAEHQGEQRTSQDCKRCGLRCATKRELDHHKRSAHRDHMCDTCGMAFDTKYVLDTHRKRHSTVRQHKCEYCPLEYYTKAEMLLHVRQIHLKAFEVNCPECALPFQTRQTLAQHMKTHTNQRTHTCNVCGFSFKAHTHLNRHMKELHEGVQYQCEHCDATYRRKDKLRMHVEKKHNIQTYFVCEICLQSYDSADKLQEHKAHHQYPKEGQCGVCLGAYLTPEEFEEHRCITYRENYICCNRDFKYHFFYNKHQFLVHGTMTNVRVKPVDGILLSQYRAKRKQAERCTKCEQEFPTRLQKKQHMETCDSKMDGTLPCAIPVELSFEMAVQQCSGMLRGNLSPRFN